MTKSRRHVVTFGASLTFVGASVLFVTLFLSVLNPIVSRAEDANPAPTPVGIEVVVPVIEVPAAPAAAAIVPVGAAADTAQVEVVVTGLAPYSYFELYVRSTPVLVASGFADSAGTFKVTIALPPSLVVGTHSLEVKATDAGGQPYVKTVSQFTVTADRRLGGAGPGSSLLSPTAAATNSANPTTNSATQATQTDAAKAAAALGSAPADLGGILFIGGLITSTQPNFSPVGGTALVSLTVKNASHTTFDSNLVFWITSPLGDTVAQLDHISVAGLAPGETRTIDATMIHLAQWPLLFAHVTITPPASVEGTDLSPLTRDAFVWIWPLFAMVMAALFAGGYFLWRYLPVMTLGGRLARRNDRATLAEAVSIVEGEASLVAAEAAVIEPVVIEPVVIEPVVIELVAVAPESEPIVPVIAKKPAAPRKPRVPKAAVKPTGTPPVTPPATLDISPTDNQPIVDKPAVRKPLADKPVGRKPLTDKPAVRKPLGDKPKLKPEPEPEPEPTPKPQPENTEGGEA